MEVRAGEPVNERWRKIEEVVDSQGYRLFDLEMPAGRGGVMRIFITGREPGAVIGVGDCAKVSKVITAHPEVEELLPGEMLLEVSSPGINRKLRRPEHFEGAVGERVRLSRSAPVDDPRGATVVGVLERCEGEGEELVLHVQDERTKQVSVVPFRDIKQARTEFLFA